ncbi:RNA-directed DNA polymerase, eukaryota [Tanacetum coccineum]
MAASSFRYSRFSNADRVQNISHSIYVTNFPDSVTSRDLWNACSVYGTVVDVFIPLKKSKVDDECLIDLTYQDLTRKVKEFSSIPNLYTIFRDEGFPDVKLTYLGGLWVMIECGNQITKDNMIKHKGVLSWFLDLLNANNDFVSDERIVWVDLEGIPLNAWSRETFIRIGKLWGETLILENDIDNSFGRKRICIKTKHHVSILESFKIIVKGRVYMIRAKELFTWEPSFLIYKEKEYVSDDEFVRETSNNNDGQPPHDEVFGDDLSSDDEGVPETVFGSNLSSNKRANEDNGEVHSEDPFGVYDLLEKNKKVVGSMVSPSLSHPPGFTPVVSENNNMNNNANDVSDCNAAHFTSTGADNIDPKPQVDTPAEQSCEQVGSQTIKSGGSVLEIMEGIIQVGKSMGYTMEGCLGHKTRKEWIKALTNSFKLNFLAIQETKMSSVSHMVVKSLWGNSNYDFVCSDSLGCSGGILCIWEASIFIKDNVTISDNFVAIYGTWLTNNSKILFIVVYAPQSSSGKKNLWDYILSLLVRWNGEVIVMGDFNEVRSSNERRGSCFNPYSARHFNRFISSSGLVDIPMEGYAFTWSHPSASKMSKLDHFLLREVNVDFGPIPFRFYHSWFDYVGFDDMIKSAWSSFAHSDGNRMIRFKKKLQDLKTIIRCWIKMKRHETSRVKKNIITDLEVIDKALDRGIADDADVSRRLELKRQLIYLNNIEAKEKFQKSKIKWALEGDENSKFFHGVVNKRRSQLAIRGIFVDGVWCTDPNLIKNAFFNHFATRFQEPPNFRFKINFVFPNKLHHNQTEELERHVSHDEIKRAVWDCGDNKSPGPDGFTFEFFKTYWDLVGQDFCAAVEHFFAHGSFAKGCNSSFIALIPKIIDAKFVNDFRPPNVNCCVYRRSRKILALELNGEWSHANLHGIVNILKSFYFASGLQINFNKSQLLGVGVPHSDVVNAATLIGCSIMNNSFRYLGVMVGQHSSRLSAWDDTIDKLKARLSKWKMKTLSIGGRFTLLKSVLGATPIYNMSIFKVPRGILKVMESIRRRFFYGIDPSENKISWVAWNKVLASKNHGGLGISSFFALNRALLLKWIWRFISSDGSLWSKVIQALYGKRIDFHATKFSSIWCSIIRELHQLKDNGFDFWEHCKIRIGNGSTTRFWYDLWIGDMPLYAKFPRLFALDLNKDCSVADKLNNSVELSFRRAVRGGIEQHQMSDLVSMLESIVLSSSNDRWVCGLSNGW